MVDQQSRLLGALAMLPVLLLVVGCGGDDSDSASPAAPPEIALTAQASASPGAPKPDQLTGHKSAPADETVAELTGFISPTGNVACMIEPSRARCDIIDRDWSLPPRPADCELDYGQGISLNSGGSAEFVCAGDTAFGPDEVLPYGSSTVAGALRCESAEPGITCRDGQTGHGFSIAREAYRIF